jgi:cytochrome b561
MSTQNAPARYHPVHVVLHWLMFLLVTLMLGVGKVVMPGVPADSPQKPSMLQAHAYIGGFITLLLIVRVVLLFTTKRPAPADAGNAFLNWVARAVHYLFYLLLIGMAISGLGMFQQADLPAIFSGAAPYPGDFFIYPPRSGHGLISTLLVLLIILHVGAALYHQFIRKDNLLARMWFGKR